MQYYNLFCEYCMTHIYLQGFHLGCALTLTFDFDLVGVDVRSMYRSLVRPSFRL